MEDEAELVRALRINLRARQYEVRCAGTGREALAVAATRPPDAIILDLGLPDIDGTEVIVELRRWFHAPIIVLSGRTSPGDKIGALDVGADDYVTKPFAMAELLARLRAALRRDEGGAAAGSRPAVIGRWLIDLAAHQVRRTDAAGGDAAGGDAGLGRPETLRLTPTEWQILEMLLCRPGQLVGSAQLLTNVWGPGFSERTNYLRFHMARLRRKLEDDPARPRHLLTEPGMGYRYQPLARRRLPRDGHNVRVYQSDQNLVVPPDDTPLWRYLDFARFLALLDSASLWFARADTFSDQYELAVPAADMAAARQGAASILADNRTREGVVRYLAATAGRAAGELAALPDGELAGLLLRFADRALHISCWQEDQDESAGMWDSFVQGDEGVAVVTTVAALRDVLDAGSGNRDVFLGRVAYLDYRAGSWGAFHPFAPAFHKRRLFRQEQEVRAVMVWPSYRDLADGIIGTPAAAGIAVPVDLSRLIQGIVIAPGASSWLSALVSSILHRYGLSTVPVSSELSRGPDW